MITNIYYLHAPIDSNIFTTIHNLLKHTQQDKILSLTFLEHVLIRLIIQFYTT